MLRSLMLIKDAAKECANEATMDGAVFAILVQLAGTRRPIVAAVG